jgi:hypothetical protein
MYWNVIDAFPGADSTVIDGCGNMHLVKYGTDNVYPVLFSTIE